MFYRPEMSGMWASVKGVGIVQTELEAQWVKTYSVKQGGDLLVQGTSRAQAEEGVTKVNVS
jgi:hypothetical protein